jgi:hypothetical protein
MTQEGQIPAWVNDMLELHLQGQTPLEMSRTLAVSRGAVYYWLDKLDREPYRRNVYPLDEDDRQVALAAYRGGAKPSTIARVLDRPYSQVWYLLSTQEDN